MSIELTAIPLALMAGMLGILSPCVWPLVPVVVSSAASSGRSGPFFLAGGMTLSFAVAGTLLTLLLVTAGLDPELFRYLAAGLLIAIAVPLLVPRVGEWLTLRLSFLTSRLNVSGPAGRVSGAGQFGVGALLGIVWLPCVGPTLGAAIALASLGQSMGMAFLVMLSYGVGTAAVLLAAGMISGRLLAKWRPRIASGSGAGKTFLGVTLLVLGLLVLTGFDKVLEVFAITVLPEWLLTM